MKPYEAISHAFSALLEDNSPVAACILQTTLQDLEPADRHAAPILEKFLEYLIAKEIQT